MRHRLALVACLVASIPAVGVAQGYTFRPGPRGFDPKLNRYGETEAPAAASPAITGDRFNPSRTNVRVELLMPGNRGTVDAQQWSRTLAELGYPARMRRPVLNDKPEVSETTRGPLRFVTVIGTLDDRGTLVFPMRSFSPGQAGELKEWLDELKAYGAQGSPEGRPLWGLSRSQFETVYAALSRPVTADVAGLPLREAIGNLPIPSEHALRFSVAANESVGATVVSRSVAGLTAGTALAFVLSEHSLGFHPERTPEGAIDLIVEPLSEAAPSEDAAAPVYWPAGWNVEEAGPPERGSKPVRDEDAVAPNRMLLAPTLFSMKEVSGFQNTPLLDAFAAIEATTGVPVLIDRAGIEAAEIELSKARATLPAKRTSWSIVLRSLTFPNRLKYELRHDEVGHPVVWVTPLRLGR